jgi:hypothetical protein
VKTPPRRRFPMVITIVLLAALGACSSGDDQPAVAEDPELERYCSAIETIQTTSPQGTADTEEEARAVTKQLAEEKIKPLAEEALDALEGADGTVLEAAQVFYGTFISLADEGDYTLLDRPEHLEASGTVHAFDLASCNWNLVEITMNEYSYTGMPAELEAGVTSLDFDNAGSEVHEASVFEVDESATKTVEELLDLGPGSPEAAQFLEFIGHLEIRPEGTPDDYGIQDFAPGRYALICYLPVGATPEKLDDPNFSSQGAERHYSRGEIAEFTVR